MTPTEALTAERDALRRAVVALAGWVEELDPTPDRLRSDEDENPGPLNVGAYLPAADEDAQAAARLALEAEG